MNKLPVIFVDHGSPDRILKDNNMNKQLSILWDSLTKKIKWIVIFSAHLTTRWTYISSGNTLQTVYDFYGFVDELYSINYDVETDIELINKIQSILPEAQKNDSIWIDHWAWTVLKKMFPKRDKKVVMISLNLQLSWKDFFEIWTKLRKLRKEWYLIIWSWWILHNFSELTYHSDKVFDWAEQFNEDIKTLIIKKKFVPIIDYPSIKNSNKAFHTTEHFNPLLIILGTIDEDDEVKYINDNITMGSLSNNLITFGEI